MSSQLLLVRGMSDRESSESLSVYPRTAVALVGLAGCLSSGFVAVPFLPACYVAAAGALGGLGWIMLVQASKYAPASSVAPFQYSQMAFGAVFGYLFWRDVPDSFLLSGTAIIVAASLWLIRHERRASRMMVHPDAAGPHAPRSFIGRIRRLPIGS